MSKKITSKLCTECETKKKLSDFYACKSNADGLFGKCKECVSIDRAEYYLDNKEKMKEHAISWQNANRDKRNKKRAAWREKYRKHLRIQDAGYRATKKAKAIE